MSPITFPDPATWIPNLDALNDIGEGLLEVALGALALFPDDSAPAGTTRTLADRYERHYVGHGTAAPTVPSKAKQITVVCTNLFVGRAGEQRYQFVKGDSGAYGYHTAAFSVEITAPWPAGMEPTGVGLQATSEYDAKRRQINRDTMVVWSAMLGLAMGGVSRPWPTQSLRGDGMAVGPMQPRDPNGTAASWYCLVHVEV